MPKVVRRTAHTASTGAAMTVLRTTFEGAHKRTGAPVDEDDPIERLGRKIGRGAGAVFALGLVVYLIWTYVISPA